MGALKGTAKYRRFSIDGNMATVGAVHSVNARKFIPTSESETVTFGWTKLTDPLSEENVTTEDLHVGQLICLGFRFDQRVVKAADVRDELKKRVRELQDEQGRKLSRQERFVIKEAVIAELRAQAPVQRKVAELVCDPVRKEARLFGATKLIAQVCTELFEKTFQCSMEEMSVESLIRRLDVPTKDDSAEPAELGALFLTKLWYQSQFVDDVEESKFTLGDSLKIRNMDGSGSEVAIKGETAASTQELFSGLHRGALITVSKSTLELGNNILTGGIKADTLVFNGAKLPKEDAPEPEVEEGEKPGSEAPKDARVVEDEARLLSRMAHLDDAQDALDSAFKKFLEDNNAGKLTAWKTEFREKVTSCLTMPYDSQDTAA